jgi:hypothetical protein
MHLSDKIKQAGGLPESGPVWKGPEVDGITFSLLSRFLVCRDRFKALVVDGIKPKDRFDAKLEFGHLWHICEECYARGEDKDPKLVAYGEELMKRYPFEKPQDIGHWVTIVAATFTPYAKHWERERSYQNPIAQEQVFDVMYDLPSGRKVRLRGKWDGIFTQKHVGWIQENKTKSSIDKPKLERQLRMDLQTMMYCVAFEQDSAWDRIKLGGVRYNVVKRSAHKSIASLGEKIFSDNKAGRIQEWFCRFEVDIKPKDLETFRKVCFDPILENLCWWYEVEVLNNPMKHFPPLHWRHPFGVYNVLDEGGSTELDEYLDNGSMAGLQRVQDLFPELR